jgi:hypothetical protein
MDPTALIEFAAVIGVAYVLLVWSVVHKRRAPIIVVGVVLLALAFLFPYTSHPIKRPSEDGRSITFTTQHGFRPLWTALAEHKQAAQEQPQLKGNMFADTIILWPVVTLIAVIVLIMCGAALYRVQQQGAQAAAPDLAPKNGNA